MASEVDSNGGIIQPSFTFFAVINTLEAKGYNHIKTIHKHSDRVYEICAGKDSKSTALFLMNASGNIKITLTHIDIVPYSWLPDEARKANDAFVKQLKHAPTFFEVETDQTAVMSDEARKTMWHYNKETNTIYE